MMRVLFVEDDAMNRRVVREMLSVAGVDMTDAENAEIGLKTIEEQDFDLILMDLRMPGMGGLDAIRHIRSRTDGKRKLPIIVVTADATLHLRADCLDIGANDVIVKPVAMNILFDTIGRMIASGECQSELV